MSQIKMVNFNVANREIKFLETKTGYKVAEMAEDAKQKSLMQFYWINKFPVSPNSSQLML